MLQRPVIFASSAPGPSGNLDWVELPLDAPSTGPAAQATAGGRLHWAPLRHRGLLERHRRLLDLVAEHDPVLAVVDVSAEVTTLLRVSGVPVVTVRLPGDRCDAPHQLAHDLAEQVVMPVPAGWGMTGGTSVGLVSLLSAAAATPSPTPAYGPVLVLLGAGGSALTAAHCRDLAAGGRPVLVAGRRSPGGPARTAEYVEDGVTWLGEVADPSSLIAAASVVVGGAGLGTVADVATIGRPFVCIPDDRPFGEQRATAQALASYEAASVHQVPPTGPAGWAAAVSAAEQAGPLQADTGGAARFGVLLETAFEAALR